MNIQTKFIAVLAVLVVIALTVSFIVISVSVDTFRQSFGQDTGVVTDEALQTPIDQFRNRMILTVVGMAFLAAITLGIVASSITRPIHSLVDVIERISRGDMEQEISPELKQRDDEIGALARAFDRTLVSLKLAMKRTAPALEKKVVKTEEARQETREELLETESLLESTLDATVDGILVVDTDGSIVYNNDRFQEMWRIPDEVMESGDDAEALGYVMDQLKDPAAFREQVEYLYNHPEEDSVDIVEFEDGRVFERYSRPQRLNGEIVGRVWSFEDVTERYRLLYEQTRSPVFTVSLDETIRTMNQAARELLECDSEELIGEPVTVLHPAVEEEAVRALLEDVGDGGMVQEELTFKKCGGETFTAELQALPVTGRQGKVLLINVTLTGFPEQQDT